MSEESFPAEASGTRIGQPHFAPGTAAKHERGVLYQGDYQHPADGSSRAVRLHARALAMQGVPVLLRSITSTVMTEQGTFDPLYQVGLSEGLKAEVGDLLETSISKLYPTIRHLVIHKTEDISKLLMRGATSPFDTPENLIKARSAVYAGSILYSVWERDRLDPKMARELSKVLDNWVPCHENANMLRSQGVENVYVVPHPYQPESVLARFTERKVQAYRGADLRKRRFYSIGRWEPRKNQHGLLRAFCAAFHPDDDVHLTLKWHGAWPEYASFPEFVSTLLREHPKWAGRLDERLTIIPHHLPEDKILKLHFENNIYVAASRGEAWCLPAFEAKVAGNRLVHVPYGGTADFADPVSDLSVEYRMGVVPLSYGWPSGSQWAEPDHDSLVTALRRASPPEAFVRSPDFEARFSLQAVGRRMFDRIQTLTGKRAEDFV